MYVGSKDILIFAAPIPLFSSKMRPPLQTWNSKGKAEILYIIIESSIDTLLTKPLIPIPLQHLLDLILKRDGFVAIYIVRYTNPYIRNQFFSIVLLLSVYGD